MSQAPFPVFRSCPERPPEEHLRLLSDPAVPQVELLSGNKAWILARAADVREMLSDPRFSANRADQRFPVLAAKRRPRPAGSFVMSMNYLDGADHARIRHAVNGEFSARSVDALRPRAQAALDACLDEVMAEGRTTDFVKRVTRPFTCTLMCELLGIPSSDQPLLRENLDLVLVHKVTPDVLEVARRAVLSYLADIISAKRADRTDDLLGRQITLSERGTGLTGDKELLALAHTMLLAGYEPPAGIISLAVYTLLTMPHIKSKLLLDRSLVRGAIDELLRFYSVDDHSAMRFALEDVELGGALIHAGDAVIGLTNTANRDPCLFERPHELDIERDARRHLSFGFGPHRCIGSRLATMMVDVAIGTVLDRLPGLQLRGTVKFRENVNIYDVESMPVLW